MCAGTVVPAKHESKIIGVPDFLALALGLHTVPVVHAHEVLAVGIREVNQDTREEAQVHDN